MSEVTKKKGLTAEEMQAVVDAKVVVAESGLVSEKAIKVMELVDNWYDTEANAEKKAEVIESFGGVQDFKDYIDGEFQEEITKLAGFAKLISVLNLIKSFYARRASKGGVKKSKVKTTIVNIGGDSYHVSAELLKSLKDAKPEEKRQAILADENTVKVEAMEVL